MEKSIPTHKRAILLKTTSDKRLSVDMQYKISEIIKEVCLSRGDEAAEQIAEELTEIINSCETEKQILEAIKNL